VDTLDLSRRTLKGQNQHSLDALCRRFNINKDKRVLHGALIDADLLADVYVELTGGRNLSMQLQVRPRISITPIKIPQENSKSFGNPTILKPDATELLDNEAHRKKYGFTKG
jgi:DNA polymerase-3 subunit epsilon